MARKQREISATGVYHVILRGVNKQRIFEWVEDYQAMIDILTKVMDKDTMGNTAEEPTYDLYAYCLMDNHVHMLMKPNQVQIGDIVRRITGSYAQYFNHRYKRVGHLFQERFKSTPVNDRDYFLELMRYIHNNPVKAGICRTPDLYPYSSFCELTGKKSNQHLCKITQGGLSPMCNFDEIQEFLNEMPHQSTKEKMTQKGLSLLCKTLRIDIEQQSPEDADRQIVETLLELGGVRTVSDFQQLDKKKMRGALAVVRDAGCSIRRLSRLSGISEGIIRGCKNPNNLLGN